MTPRSPTWSSGSERARRGRRLQSPKPRRPPRKPTGRFGPSAIRPFPSSAAHPGIRSTRSFSRGFLTLGRMFDNNVHDVLDDRIDTTTRGFLGLTVSCARCHDHKYDPILTADYYSLYGVFASSDAPLELPLIERPEDTPDGIAF